MKIINEIWEAFTYILGLVLMTAVTTLFVGALFAPCFLGMIAPDLQLKAAGSGCTTVEELQDANRKLMLTKLALWITAILAWTTLIVTNLFYWRAIR
jgi:hypothetical protein